MSTLTAVGDPAVNAELSIRVAASAPTVEPPPPLPEPEIRWRDATAEEIASCGSAASLVKKAGKVGYDVRAKFARGPFIGADGQPLGDADALAVLCRWENLEAYAIWYWRDGKLSDKGKPAWELGAAYSVRPHVRLGGNELSHWLCGTEPAAKKS